MGKIRRIPTFEVSERAADRIEKLQQRLGIEDARDLIDRAVRALEVLADTVDDGDNTVNVASRSGARTREVELRP